MEKYLVEQTCALTSVTTLPRFLPDLSANEREEECTEDCIQGYLPMRSWQRGQAAWWICRWYRTGLFDLNQVLK